MAPYISDEGFEAGREAGIGLIDLSGNCLLNFEQIYIELRGRPNLFPKLRFPKSIFSPRSSRIIRVLLNTNRRDWSVQDLAEEAQVSLGLVSSIKRKLKDYEFVRERGKLFSLASPEALLNKWSEGYSYNKNKLHDFYSFDDPRELEIKVAEYCQKNNLAYAFSLFSGAARLAPFSRYNRSFVYLEREGISQIAEALNLKSVTTGPTITIMEPYDEGIFYTSQNIDGLRVANDVQVYLDLKNYKGRGEEAADFLLTQRIRPRWQENQITNNEK